jgi:hypothetical protein
MMTAMLTAKNILAGQRKYDVWAVNQDAEYHEAGSAGAQTAEVETWVPVSVSPKTGATAALSHLDVPRRVGKSAP